MAELARSELVEGKANHARQAPERRQAVRPPAALRALLRAPATGVVVITGASSGIGLCTAALFGRHGWQVGLIARGEAGLAVACHTLTAGGGTAAAACADVSDSAALERAAIRLEDELGPIDVWINCAGNGVYGRFTEVPAAEFDRVTAVTYLGTVNGTRAALRRMLPRDSGTVVNVCSAIAFHGMPLLSSYSGAKHAVRGFTEAVRCELAQEGSRVRLSTVYPPAVNTPFFSHAISHMPHSPRPMRPVYQPEIVADGILLAATSGRRELQIGGTTVGFGLVNRIAPWLVDRAIRKLGYNGQMTKCGEALRLRDPTMFAPSGRPAGMRGPFDAGARRFSTQMWFLRHRLLCAAVLLVVAIAAARLFFH